MSIVNQDNHIQVVTVGVAGPPGPAASGVTAENVRDIVAALLEAGDNVTLDYDDSLDSLTITATGGVDDEEVMDIVADFIVAGDNVTIDHDDANDQFIINVDSGGGASGITTEDVRDIVGTTVVAGNNASVVVNDLLNTVTIHVVGLTSAEISNFSEAVDDRVNDLIVDGSAITKSYNDAGNLLTLSVAVDDSTIEVSGDALRVKDGGITTAKLSFDPATQTELNTAVANAVNDGDTAGGVLGGTYPNPSFAADMATQAELDAHVTNANAHAASVIAYGGGTGISATNVESALDELATEKADSASAVMDGDTAGGVLSGTYPNPGFAADMATQAELNTHIAAGHSASTISVSISSFDQNLSGADNNLQTALETIDELALGGGDFLPLTGGDVEAVGGDRTLLRTTDSPDESYVQVLADSVTARSNDLVNSDHSITEHTKTAITSTVADGPTGASVTHETRHNYAQTSVFTASGEESYEYLDAGYHEVLVRNEGGDAEASVQISGAGGGQILSYVTDGVSDSTTIEQESDQIRLIGPVEILEVYTLPLTDGASGHAMVTDGSGVVSFQAVGGGHASTVAFTPNGSIGATNVQAAIQEVRDEAGVGGYSDEDARDAIGAALTPGSGIDIDVNDGLDTITITVDPSEFSNGSVPLASLDTDVATQAELNTHIAAGHSASTISYAGSASLVANNVEAALDELDTEMLRKQDGIHTGILTLVNDPGELVFMQSSDHTVALGGVTGAYLILASSDPVLPDFTSPGSTSNSSIQVSESAGVTLQWTDGVTGSGVDATPGYAGISYGNASLTIDETEALVGNVPLSLSVPGTDPSHAITVQQLDDHVWSTTSVHHASIIPVDVTNFDGNLSASDTTVQAALETIDEMVGGGYTDEEARDAVGAALVAGTAIDITIVDGSDTITIDVDPSEFSNGTIPVAALSVDVATQSELDAHVTNANAHAASVIAYGGGTGMSATNVETALDELATEKADASAAVLDGDAAGGVLSGTYPNPGFAADMATQVELDAHITATSVHHASVIPFTPGASISATDVQAAIEEVREEVGVDGEDGTTWYSGIGAPSDGLGIDGDFYLDSEASAWYGPKDSGTWAGTGPVDLLGNTTDLEDFPSASAFSGTEGMLMQQSGSPVLGTPDQMATFLTGSFIGTGGGTATGETIFDVGIGRTKFESSSGYHVQSYYATDSDTTPTFQYLNYFGILFGLAFWSLGGSRVVGDAVTNGTAIVTSATAAFVAGDVNKPVSGTNIPANAYIVSRDSATQITISAAATGSTSGGTLTIGGIEAILFRSGHNALSGNNVLRLEGMGNATTAQGYTTKSQMETADATIATSVITAKNFAALAAQVF